MSHFSRHFPGIFQAFHAEFLSKFINVAGPISGARCKGGTHRWRAGATTAAVLAIWRYGKITIL